MPNVIVSFKEAGIAAIERSKRGIVALILEEEQSTILLMNLLQIKML